MKRLALFSFLLILSINVFSQSRSKSIDLKWGPELKLKKHDMLREIVAKDQKGFYVYKSGKGVFLQYYGNDMQLKKEKEIELKTGKDQFYFKGFYNLQGKVYLFSTFQNKKQKKNYLFAQSINLSSLTPNGDMKKVAEIGYDRKKNTGGFTITTSPDSSRLLVRYDLPYEKGSPEKFGFHVFDQTLQQLWTKQITIPYRDDLFSIYKTNVDANGNAYLLGKRYKDKVRNERKGRPNFDYIILRYSDAGKTKNEIPISLANRFITDFTFRVRKNGEMVCAGFYSDNSMSSIKGTFFMSIDGKTWKVKKSSTKDFDLDFIVEGLSNKQEKKVRKKASKGKNIEMAQYDLDHLILRSDGGAVLLAEQFYIRTVTTTHTNSNGGTYTTTTYYYHFNDIIAVSINPSGDIDWASKIDKAQVSTSGTLLLSYYVKVVKDKMYFIYNGSPREIYKTGADRRANKVGKGFLVIAATIDSKGKVEKEPLFSIKDVSAVCIPMLSENLSNKESVMVCKRGKKQILCKATFK